MAATPSAPILNHTPPTPRHAGGHYTRKGTRINTTPRSRAVETPPPRTTHSSRFKSSMSQPSSTATSSSANAPQYPTRTSPRNIKKTEAFSGAMETSLLESASGQSSRPDPVAPDKPPELDATKVPPTPASLPRKKQIPRAGMGAAARVLFPSGPDPADDPMPVPRKGRKIRKHRVFSLHDPSGAEEVIPDEKVHIYTDSRDKIPELDQTEENPFLDSSQQALASSYEPLSRRMKKRKHQPAVVANPQIEEAFNRDKGMVYVFRGKKVYRPFPKDSDSELEESPTGLDHPDSLESPGTSHLRPLTRSSIKPRLLFANASETAETPLTAPVDFKVGKPGGFNTPMKKLIEPLTPPATKSTSKSAGQKVREDGHAQHNLAMDVDQTVLEPFPERKKKVSPFDGWARTKAGVGAPKGKKREAEESRRDDGDDGKRIRSGTRP